ncbi:MAG: IS200/IS605 family transposase [Cyanobacteria bacterium QS_8_48_54]|nr:MAG: IS200/IS605 family transposase [Cyanobacteria bacterium QS_8_48_54]
MGKSVKLVRLEHTYCLSADMTYQKGWRTVYSLSAHVVLVTKYRRNVINNEILSPHIQLSKLIANLKTVSSRLIRKEFRSEVNRYYRESVFWTGAYFVASCGGVTVDELKRYVDNQRKINGDFD